MMSLQAWIIISTIYSTVTILTCLAVGVGSVNHHGADDEIASLPGQPQLKVIFRQFSGYITVDENQHRALFFYFVEAENDPASKPLVLWLTGGPACSSVGYGAFWEHGPFKPSGNVLVKNDYSWNKEANILYLESPAGVGFSYSANKSFYAYVNDDMTARDNLIFLENWFDKYPAYKNRDFFMMGESYAGHYVPQLANLIIQSKANINLKGIAIGNPLLEFNSDANSRAEYFWSHGMISDATYEDFTSVCNFSQIMRQQQIGNLSRVCSRVINQVQTEISKFVDLHHVTLDVCLASVSQQSQALNQVKEREKINVCIEGEVVNYLNRKDVQKALHAQLVGVSNWTICSEILRYDMQNMEIPTIHVLGSLVKSGIRVLVYSGDQDAVVPLISTRKLVNGLAKDLKLNTTVPYSAWFEGKQVAGWTQVYGNVLSFATVRGASHEVPFVQPERSLVLLSSFLQDKPLPAPAVNGTKDKKTNNIIKD